MIQSEVDAKTYNHVKRRKTSIKPVPSLRDKRFLSIGLFAGLKHFSLFEGAIIGASISVALAPISAPPKSEKCLERTGKPTETLAKQGNRCQARKSE